MSSSSSLSPSSSDSTEAIILQALQRLIEVVARLRSPGGGCPWDLAQTQVSLIPYVIEEAYEVVHAIQSGDQMAIAEELGDLLLQVVLQAQVAEDEGKFDLAAVAAGISDKLIRRHPHVFGTVEVADESEVRANWEVIKAQEKGLDPGVPQPLSAKLERYTRTLPPLLASEKISKKAAKAGFEWENIDGVWDKFAEELQEFRDALATENKAHQRSELGDLLFTVINIARWHGLDCDQALASTNERFIQRLKVMETVGDRPLENYNLAELEDLWQQAKAQLQQGRQFDGP